MPNLKMFTVDLPECETDWRYVRVCFSGGATQLLTLDSRVETLRLPHHPHDSVVSVEVGVCDPNVASTEQIEWEPIDLSASKTTTTTTTAPPTTTVAPATTTTTTTTTTVAPTTTTIAPPEAEEA